VFFNPSISLCWKGCDFATGRVNEPELRYFYYFILFLKMQRTNLNIFIFYMLLILDKRLKICAKDIPLKSCGLKRDNWVKIYIIEKIEDLRVHSEMFPTKPENIYRACLAGIRR